MTGLEQLEDDERGKLTRINNLIHCVLSLPLCSADVLLFPFDTEDFNATNC